jgi:hypothetical protein
LGKDAFEKIMDAQGFYVRCRPNDEANKPLGDRVNKISSVQPMTADTTQGDACSINVGAGTPTWVINGQKYVGEQTLEDLSRATGCPLPN